MHRFILVIDANAKKEFSDRSAVFSQVDLRYALNN